MSNDKSLEQLHNSIRGEVRTVFLTGHTQIRQTVTAVHLQHYWQPATASCRIHTPQPPPENDVLPECSNNQNFHANQNSDPRRAEVKAIITTSQSIGMLPANRNPAPESCKRLAVGIDLIPDYHPTSAHMCKREIAPCSYPSYWDGGAYDATGACPSVVSKSP